MTRILEVCPEHGEPLKLHPDKLRCPSPRCEVTAPLPESLRLSRLGPATAPRLML